MTEDIDWEIYGFLIGSNYRVKVALSLVSHPQIPSKIANEIDMNLPHVSRTLNELEENGLVECLTPNRSKSRLYKLTELGRRMIEKYKEFE